MPADARPERSIARVLRDGKPVGLAFAVGPRQMVTCAHVVNAALNRKMRESAPPTDGWPPLVVDFLFAETSPRRSANVTSWLPGGGGRFDLNDVAALALDADVPPGVVILTPHAGDPTGPVQMFGPTPDSSLPGHVQGELVGWVDRARLQIDQDLRGVFRVVKGFSGGPAWRRDTGHVVGVLHASNLDDGANNAYVLAVDLIREAWPALAAPPPVARRPAEPRDPTQLTIMHLSDLRFGADDHEFGTVGLTDADRRRDTMQARLLDDVAGLPDVPVPWPDLIVVTGNVTSTARREDFEQARAFLTDLAAGLRLGHNRIVVVPGRSDVNLKLCQAHVLTEEAHGHQAVAPYWPKWAPFADMYGELHGTAFAKDEPWHWADLPELGVAVAGINSTMAQSHLPADDYGAAGEAQLTWFSSRMADATRRGWLRIGVIHHGPTPDGGLHDADRFGHLLAPHLHAVLHAQAGGSRIARIGIAATPAIGAGGPASYQLLRFTDTGLRIYARRFNPRTRTFGGDNDISADGNSWWCDVPIDLGPLRTALRPDRLRTLEKVLDRTVEQRDDLAARTEKIVALRWPGAVVNEVVRGDPPIRYLRVSVAGGAGVEQFPIAVLPGGVTRDDIESFATNVASVYRTDINALSATIVYDGPLIGSDLREWAGSPSRRVALVHFDDFQLVYDLRPFAERQIAESARDRRYPPDIYVPQRYLELARDGKPRAVEPREDVLERLRGWITDDDGHLIVVLAPFGHGKTFLMRELARRLHRDGDRAVPVVIHLRDLEKTHTLDQLVAAQLVAGGENRVDLDRFRYLLAEGRIALFFDGFDELAMRVTYDRAAEHLRALVQAASGRAKVILTSRDHHFISDREVAVTALEANLARAAQLRLIKLVGFDEGQIMRFLRRQLDDKEKAARLFNLLVQVRDLSSLAENPRMLSFIADIEEQRLEQAHRRDGKVTAATLYRELLGQWLDYEHTQVNESGGLGKEDLWAAVTNLAGRLWHTGQEALALSDLGDSAAALGRMTDAVHQPPGAGWTIDETAHLVGARSLLVRDGDGQFTFVHRSVMEWLVCQRIADALRAGDARPADLSLELSELMVDFLDGLIGRTALSAWLSETLTSPGAEDGMRTNALLCQQRLGIEVVAPLHLTHEDLRGQDLSGRDLRRADLSGADLTDARLTGADLSDAQLNTATLRYAELNGANLRNADVTSADLTGARLIGAHLTGANLEGARLRRAALVNAVATEGEILGADTRGAAFAVSSGLSLQLAGGTESNHSIAFDDRGELLAAACADGVVRVWDAHSGTLVRVLTGHTGGVLSVVFSSDGTHLATGGDDGVVRVWDAHTGGQLFVTIALADGGWAAFGDNLRYKLEGTPNGEFWYVINMCRFEPGELDAYAGGPERLPLEYRFGARP